MKYLIFVFVYFSLLPPFAQAKTDKNQFVRIEHSFLKDFAGNWKVTYNFNSPYSESSQGKGEAKGSIILNDIALQLSVNLIHLNKNFERISTIGYDTAINKYYIMGLDESGVMPFIAYGDYDSQKREFFFKGVTRTEEEEQKQLQVRIYFERDDKFFYEYYITDAGRWYKTLTMAFIKK